MYKNDIQKKLNMISAKFSIDQQYAKQFFGDYEFAKKESSNFGLQMDPELYANLGRIYKQLNVSTKYETFEEHWNSLTYKNKSNEVSKLSKTPLIANIAAIFSSISKLKMKFRDRESAADVLASALEHTIKNYRHGNQEGIIVFGIPRGGVVTADIIARKLSADLDIVIARKIGDPENKEQAIGSIVTDRNGNISTYLNQEIVNKLNISYEYLEKEKSSQIEEIEHKRSLYCAKLKTENKIIRNKIAFLIDDGIETGATIIAAARAIRQLEPKHLVIAAPVARKQTIRLLKQEADFVETIIQASNLSSVGRFYRNFETVTDKQVIKIVNNRSMASDGPGIPD
jgi:predicted phosphoribosyltransferase